jgi:hypothetical protein
MAEPRDVVSGPHEADTMDEPLPDQPIPPAEGVAEDEDMSSDGEPSPGFEQGAVCTSSSNLAVAEDKEAAAPDEGSSTDGDSGFSEERGELQRSPHPTDPVPVKMEAVPQRAADQGQRSRTSSPQFVELLHKGECSSPLQEEVQTFLSEECEFSAEVGWYLPVQDLWSNFSHWAHRRRSGYVVRETSFHHALTVVLGGCGCAVRDCRPTWNDRREQKCRKLPPGRPNKVYYGMGWRE